MSTHGEPRGFRRDRREALRYLVGGGLGWAAGFTSTSRVLEAAVTASTAAAGNQNIPKGAIIRTLLKDVPPESLGVTLFHEHLHGSLTLGLQGGPGAPQVTPIGTSAAPSGRHFSEHFDVMVEELRAAGREGVTCFVDAGHEDQGRRVPYLRQLSIASGMPIVASGGYHGQNAYPEEVFRSSEDDLVDEFVRMAAAQRWGALGEIGFAEEEPSPTEIKVARAVARAHLQTGLPVFTHTDQGKGALEQLDTYEKAGMNPQHLVIGHVGNLVDPKVEVHKAIAKRGAFLGFDRAVRTEALDKDMVTMVLALIEAGYTRNILLSADIGSNKEVLKAYGGPGYAKTWTVFVPRLRQAGVKEDVIRQITVDNPRRFLSFLPKGLSGNGSSAESVGNFRLR